GACAPPTNSLCWHEEWYPMWQCGQVLSEAKKEPITNWPGLIDVTALPTCSTVPQYSCPIGVGSVVGFRPRYGHKSDPHTQLAATRIMASLGSMMIGAGRSSKRRSRGP